MSEASGETSVRRSVDVTPAAKTADWRKKKRIVIEARASGRCVEEKKMSEALAIHHQGEKKFGTKGSNFVKGKEW